MKTVVINGLRYSLVKEKVESSCLGCVFHYTECFSEDNPEWPCAGGHILKRHYKMPLIKVITK